MVKSAGTCGLTSVHAASPPSLAAPRTQSTNLIRTESCHPSPSAPTKRPITSDRPSTSPPRSAPSPSLAHHSFSRNKGESGRLFHMHPPQNLWDMVNTRTIASLRCPSPDPHLPRPPTHAAYPHTPPSPEPCQSANRHAPLPQPTAVPAILTRQPRPPPPNNTFRKRSHPTPTHAPSFVVVSCKQADGVIRSVPSPSAPALR
jgi:hypothetical protein